MSKSLGNFIPPQAARRRIRRRSGALFHAARAAVRQRRRFLAPRRDQPHQRRPRQRFRQSGAARAVDDPDLLRGQGARARTARARGRGAAGRGARPARHDARRVRRAGLPPRARARCGRWWREANRYVDEEAPWALARATIPRAWRRCSTCWPRRSAISRSSRSRWCRRRRRNCSTSSPSPPTAATSRRSPRTPWHREHNCPSPPASFRAMSRVERANSASLSRRVRLEFRNAISSEEGRNEDRGVKRTAFAMPLTSPSFPPRPLPLHRSRIPHRSPTAPIPRRSSAWCPSRSRCAAPHVKYQFIRMPDSARASATTARSGQVDPRDLRRQARRLRPFAVPRRRGADRRRPRDLGLPREARQHLVQGRDRHARSARSIMAASASPPARWATSTRRSTPRRWRKAMGEPSFLLKIIPHVDCTPRILELVRYYFEDVTVKGAWTGPAALELAQPRARAAVRLPVLESRLGRAFRRRPDARPRRSRARLHARLVCISSTATAISTTPRPQSGRRSSRARAAPACGPCSPSAPSSASSTGCGRSPRAIPTSGARSASIRTRPPPRPMPTAPPSSPCTAHAKVVGIGETGLDFYYDHSPRAAPG